MDLERVREREPEPGCTKYDQTLRERAQWVQRAMTGQVVIRGAEREYEPNRQGHIKRYLNREPDLTHTIGLDRGAGFEQLKACPEYRAK